MKPMSGAKDLLQQLETETVPEARLKTLLQLSEVFLNSDIARCEEVAIQINELAQQNHLPEAAMYYHLTCGRLQYRKANLKAAFDFFTQARKMAQQLDKKTAYGNALEAIGQLMNKWGRHAEALEMIQQAIDIYHHEEVDKGILGVSYNNLASTYDSLGQSEKAVENYRLALKLLEQNNRQQSVLYVKANLALLLYNQQNFTEALNFFSEVVGKFADAAQTQAQGLSYYYIAQCHAGLNDYARALEMFQNALKLLKNSRFYNELSMVYYGLGSLYHHLNGYTNAEMYHQKALEMRLYREFWENACESYLALHHLYQTMGEHEIALEMATNGFQLALTQQLAKWQATFKPLLPLLP